MHVYRVSSIETVESAIYWCLDKNVPRRDTKRLLFLLDSWERDLLTTPMWTGFLFGWQMSPPMSNRSFTRCSHACRSPGFYKTLIVEE